MSMPPVRCLVTGGAGFIGSRLCEELLAAGHRVHAFDNLSTGSLANLAAIRDRPGFSFEHGDILDAAAVDRAVASVDRVFHLAAAVGVRLIMERPVETILTNVRGTENVLAAACRSGVPVLAASTSEVYGKLGGGGTAAADRLAEDSDCGIGPTSRRRWAYACSKALDEFLGLAYFDERKLPVTFVRFFNTVGPRQTGQYGMVIPNFVDRALRGQPIEVHGTGRQRRCFAHVDDAVRAVLLLAACPRAAGEVVNVGNDEEVTIDELARRVVARTGSVSPIVHVPYEDIFPTGFEDMERRRPDLAKLERLVGWRPWRSLDETLDDIIRFRRETRS
jgi:UDP-glucose 4-epimerase